MGYTTEFQGEFKLDKALSLSHAMILKALNESELNDDDIAQLPTMPDGYFQWEPTKSRLGIKWDGNEKFYHYDKWLQWLIDLLSSWGYKLTGEVKYQGEDSTDKGTLGIVSGKAVILASPEREWAAIPRIERDALIKYLESNVKGKRKDPVFDSAIRLLKEGKP